MVSGGLWVVVPCKDDWPRTLHLVLNSSKVAPTGCGARVLVLELEGAGCEVSGPDGDRRADRKAVRVRTAAGGMSEFEWRAFGVLVIGKHCGVSFVSVCRAPVYIS